MLLDESNIKAKAGTVSHKSSLSDPHIQKVIQHLSKETGMSVKDIEDEVKEAQAKIADLKTKSPILYTSIADNIVEQTLYKMFREKKLPDPKGVAKFDPVTFSALVRRVKSENPSFFPLRNFVDKKPLASPRIILVPTSDPKDKQFNDIETAAATPRGEFIFNTECCQRDMNFAYIQGIKPKSKKYKSNGGPFPDEWAPVEFTILHEFYHYTHGDFHYMKVIGGNPMIHNWAGDFRSNYDLMKAGHHPYAEGLFNDYINYDRQQTYAEMYKIIEDEFKKLNKQQQQQVMQAMADAGGGSDHSQHGTEKQPAMAGQGEPTMADLENHSKKTSKAAGQHKDGAEPGKAGPGGNSSSHGPGGRGKGSSSPTSVDWKQIKPRYSWKQLLDKLLRSSDTTELTYQKVHKRNITSVHLATQVGAGVVRPGEKLVPANLVKLCFVVDSSGSMHEAIKKVLAEVNSLLKNNQSQIAKTFVFVEFSTGYTMYSCTIGGGGGGTATPISGPNDMKKPKGSQGTLSVQELLSRHDGGATNFTDALAGELKTFIAQKYNVVIMTDSDILGSGNWETFSQLYRQHRQQVHLIVDSSNTFQHVAQKMGGVGAGFSHF